MAYHRASITNLNLYIKFHWNRKNFFVDGLTGPLQVQGHVTKSRTNMKNPAQTNRIRGHLPAPIANGGGVLPWKAQFSELQKPRDLDLGSGHTAYNRASVIDLYYIPNFNEIRKNFVDGRTYRRICWRTFQTPFNVIRSTRRSRPNHDNGHPTINWQTVYAHGPLLTSGTYANHLHLSTDMRNHASTSLWSPYVIGQTIMFLPLFLSSIFYLLSIFFFLA